MPEVVEAVMSRVWAMPSPDTFTIRPIRDLILRETAGCDVIIDPFARNSSLATITNDINPSTSAIYHMDALDFAKKMAALGVVADAILFDPPYSMNQLQVSYGGTKACGERGTYYSNSDYFKRLKDALTALTPGVVISCGWNSGGFGIGRGFRQTEILLCAHGGARHDTITVVERRT